MSAARPEDPIVIDVEMSHAQPSHQELMAMLTAQNRRSERWADMKDSSEVTAGSGERSAAQRSGELSRRAQRMAGRALRRRGSGSDLSASRAPSFALQTPTNSTDYLSQVSASAMSGINRRVAQLGKRSHDGFATPSPHKRSRSGDLPAISAAAPVSMPMPMSTSCRDPSPRKPSRSRLPPAPRAAKAKAPASKARAPARRAKASPASVTKPTPRQLSDDEFFDKRAKSIRIKQDSEAYKAYRARYPKPADRTPAGPAPGTPDPRDAELAPVQKWKWHLKEWFEAIKANAEVAVAAGAPAAASQASAPAHACAPCSWTATVS